MHKSLKKAIEADPILTERRHELIKKIAAIAHPQTFHRIIKLPTAALRSYLIDHHTDRIRNETIREIWGQNNGTLTKTIL